MALDAAIQCFWSRGYEATSVRDLADAMGIAGPSLYNTFGDKRTLYRQALEHYVERGFAIGSGASSPSWHLVRPSVRSSMDHRIVAGRRPAQGMPDRELGTGAGTSRRGVSGCTGRCLARHGGLLLPLRQAGQDAGAINITLPDDLARMLLGLLMGLRVLARSRPEPELLRGLVRPALALLDGAGTSQRRSRK